MHDTTGNRVPKDKDLIMPTFAALKSLGGSGSNDEILDQVILDLQLPDKVVDVPHKGKVNMTALQYNLAWARTYLKNYGVISNSARAVWSILPDYVGIDQLDVQSIVLAMRMKRLENRNKQSAIIEGPWGSEDDDEGELNNLDGVMSWRTKLFETLKTMNPFGFERLSQRLLRECGFSHVEVTKKSGDGGIDGHGKWKINGIFSFNVAFQCKRYGDVVGAGDIRDFRGSLTTDIEKGIFITTGTFSRAAKEEASKPGKQQIDLIDGEELLDKIAEYGIGVKEVKTYEIDDEFFEKI
ncbi:MAG: restriction endonuclease [Oscillospiraceae bacterium]|nr:restriction endonuclease [Oscillospiraceae bacterium]